MPRIIECQDETAWSVDECAAALRCSGFVPGDEDSLAHAALCLRRLSNNRSFIGDIMLAELKDRHRATRDSDYGAQALMLTQPENGFFLRANIWPGESDSIFRRSGAHNFAYHTPHDHNFDFLTVGYFGPGYASDYYEYDQESVAGFRGETANLRFVERATLDPGKLMLYRAHRDVHSQLPPQSLSVSLNIMSINAAQSWRDQYAFDVEHGTISRVVSPTSTEVFLRLAVGLGDEEALDLAEDFAATHPAERLRLAAFHAQSLLDADPVAQDAVWAKAERSGSRLVRAEARLHRQSLQQPAGG